MAYEHTPVTVADKRAVVIGGTSGIGRAIALGFAAEGADVIATSRDAERVADVTQEIREQGVETAAITCDVAERASVEALCEEVLETFGGVDVLVNSFGGAARQSVPDVPEEEFERVMNVQLAGIYRATQVFARAMTEQDRDDGSIIEVGSLSTSLSIPELAAYTTAKGGLEAFTRVAARDCAPTRVNAIRPGFTETPLTAEAYAEGTHRHERIAERTATGRVAQPEEIVGAAIYLASDAASYTTGEHITIDGGFAAGAFQE
ncbi:short-chain dehydrogenase [Halobacteriales archaeon QS_3_64_16]|nr:MAG: short-chain dehydrogenase [Halobacteriales archaeon QS_3_64_16]